MSTATVFDGVPGYLFWFFLKGFCGKIIAKIFFFQLKVWNASLMFIFSPKLTDIAFGVINDKE